MFPGDIQRQGWARSHGGETPFPHTHIKFSYAIHSERIHSHYLGRKLCDLTFSLIPPHSLPGHAGCHAVYHIVLFCRLSHPCYHDVMFISNWYRCDVVPRLVMGYSKTAKFVWMMTELSTTWDLHHPGPTILSAARPHLNLMARLNNASKLCIINTDQAWVRYTFRSHVFPSATVIAQHSLQVKQKKILQKHRGIPRHFGARETQYHLMPLLWGGKRAAMVKFHILGLPSL